MQLFTAGDSFTYGQELTNPQEEAWPALVAKEIHYTCNNAGEPGVSNDYIVRKTIQAVGNEKPHLAIIAWTSAGRIEFGDQHGVYDIWPGCDNKMFKADTSGKLDYRHDLIRYVTLYNNEEYEYCRWLSQVILLQSFLKQSNVPYYFINTFDNQKRNEQYMSNNAGYIKQIDTSRFIGWPNKGIVEWAYGAEHGPGGHPLANGHERIADTVLRAI